MTFLGLPTLKDIHTGELINTPIENSFTLSPPHILFANDSDAISLEQHKQSGD